MRAFVVRSFGTKKGIDFERVHDELIQPALSRIGAGGSTTGEIIEAGNIREDMFEQLVTADLVIADVSIHNANVFYELGVRHAARSRATVLIRASIDEVPFDLRTDRYLSYDPAAPDAATEQLVRTLNATLAGEQSDSPVFGLLGEYTPADHSRLIKVPRTFHEDVASAASTHRAGALRLIAEEVQGLRFEEPALRMVAAALQRVGDDRGARVVWERVRAFHADDLEANDALANIYRRLSNGSGADEHAVDSDQAIGRALSNSAVTRRQVAELSALRGSLSKLRWEAQWRRALKGEQDREALRSRELDAALRLYSRGYNEDLNHYYPGLNALALVEIAIALAERYPDEWRYHAASDDAADSQLAELRAASVNLRATVGAAIEATRQQLERDSGIDRWLGISFAELLLLRGEEPERVANAYATVASPSFGPSERATIRHQLEIYRDLQINPAQVQLVFERNAAHLKASEQTVVHPIVFAGHMIDDIGRQMPRFPADKESIARDAIREEIERLLGPGETQPKGFLGIAGAANGGDLLFHEVCHELKIPTDVMLPLPEADYRATIQADHAPDWVGRYHQVLAGAAGVRILSRSDKMPTWLVERQNYSTWQRQNRWMLHHAWSRPDVEQVTAVALWDGHVGEGPGGVADFVAIARQGGAKLVPIDTTKKFGLVLPPSAQPTAADPPAGGESEAPSIGIGTAPANDPDADDALQRAWTTQQEFSATASKLGRRIRQGRSLNLWLLIAGALLGAVSTLALLTGAATQWLSGIAAAVLAVAAVIQLQAINKDRTELWISTRSTSESLKADIYRFLARVAPYAGADRVELLNRELADVRQQQAAFQPEPPKTDRQVPDIRDFDTYVSARAQQQATWHRRKSQTYSRKNRPLRVLQLAVTLTGAILTSIAAAHPTLALSSWMAAATTIAAALGAHLAASQYRQLATRFRHTALLLDDVIATEKTAALSPGGQARFVDQIEGILAAQNGNWPRTVRAQ